jgi:hypothetical protein
MRKSLLAVAVLAVFTIGIAWAQTEKAATQEKTEKEKAPAFQYVGAGGCKMCHKSEKSGNQYGKWLESPHAKAFTTLGSEEAAEIAKKLNLKTSAQEAPECLVCHATAYGLKEDQMQTKLELADGVQCESCHGPGSAYKKISVMKDHAKAVEAGLWEVSEKTCVTCHNKQSPTYKEFDFKTAAAKIAHPTPAPAAETPAEKK